MMAPGTTSQTAHLVTDKTCETDPVGNEEFLKAVFTKAPQHTRPIIVSFDGDPSRVRRNAWFGHPWSEDDEMKIGTHANNYFSLSVFRPDDAGQYRRQKKHFVALCAVMLDDVGTKVSMERMTLTPSWLLETSTGNFQAGYILGQPIEDGAMADGLVNAIVAAGLCDPGANGPRARLARLPVAINSKYAPPFQCRMVLWSPDLRYSVEELVDGLQLEKLRIGRPQRKTMRGTAERPRDCDGVWIPRPEENAVLAALRDRGLYKAPLGDGRHDISCPWVNEHTDKVDGGTAYFEPDDSWPVGGFKCHHGHCTERHIRDLLAYLGVDPQAARMKPSIYVVAGEIHRVVDAAERELAHARRYYQRGGLIVTVITDPGTRETRIQEMTQQALVRGLAGIATWMKYDARTSDWVRTDPPARHAAVLFDSSSYPHLPVLNGLARQPYLRPDGSLMTVAGYDTATGMFGVFDARAFHAAEVPTRADAEAALEMLEDLLSEFNFVSNSDRAAALSAMLTAAIRPSLPTAPMFHVRAHVLGSGKSYLCELITAFATFQRGTPTTFPADDEECRKLLLAELLRGPAVVEFDNLTGDLLAHKSLCTALTSEYMSGRILGVSKTATVSTRALFLSSGNNVGPIQDMTRRCVTVHLDPGCEVPASRTFTRPDLVRDVLAERGRYVSAALTIVQAWIAAGRPKTECRSLASYGVWSDLCRQPLLWLGRADPASSVYEAMAEDPDRELLGRLLEAWERYFGNKPGMVREAVGANTPHVVLDGAEDLHEVLRDIAGERDGSINRKVLGRWIKRHAGQIVDGRRFVKDSGHRSADAWRVVSVSKVSSVCGGHVEKNVDVDSGG